MPKIDYIKPEGLLNSPIYTQAIKVSEGTLIFVSGQVAYDEQGNVLAEGDLRAQANYTIDNLEKVFKATGSSWENVVKLTVYVVNYNPSTDREIVRGVLRERITSAEPPANTWIGVQSLAREGLLIEIEAILAID